MVSINYLAVILAAIISMVLGFLWYGPLFGKKWIALMGWSPEAMAVAKAKGMTKSYVLMTISSLVMAYVLYYVVAYSGAFVNTSGVSVGLSSGFWIWLGFIAPVTMGSVLWEGRSWALWVLNAGYYLVSLLLMGAVLAAWM